MNANPTAKMISGSPDNLVIDSALVHQLVAFQFPQFATLVIKPVALSGWDNRTFHLGDTMSVRLPSAQGYSPQAAKEQQWLPRLAPYLPLAIPTLIAPGQPDATFPWQWGIYRWLEGEPATAELVADQDAFAKTLAHFLGRLQQIDPTDGPLAGQHSAFRGAPLATYHHQTLGAIEALEGHVDGVLAREIWEQALASTWSYSPVWFHGDVALGNLLVANGQLGAVLDFGCCGVGDPACDLVMAWTFFNDRSRAAFRQELRPDAGSWSRGRGWALWKALITLEEYIPKANLTKVSEARHTLATIFREYLASR